MLANPFNRPVAFRFCFPKLQSGRRYFPRLQSGYTVVTRSFADALHEVSLFLNECNILDPGPMELFINDEPAHKEQVA